MKFKLSNYNSFVNYNNRIICFNSISGGIFSFEKAEFNKLQQNFLIDLKRFEEEMNSLFQIFYKWGFILKDEINEIDIINYRNIRDVYLDNFYKLTINPTLQCNFKCWYCYQKRRPGFMSTSTSDLIYKFVEKLTETGQISGLNLGWFGGEPLLLFDKIIYPLSSKLKNLMLSKNLKFMNSVTTNAYLLNKQIISQLKDIELFNFQITIDGNKKQHDKVRNNNGNPSFDKIIENINILLNEIPTAHVILRINYTDETFNGLDDIFDCFPEIVKSKISIDLQRVWQTYNEEGRPINDKMIQFATKCVDAGFNLKDSFIEINKGCVCYADRFNYAHINYDGKVYKCTARNYEDKNLLGYINENGNMIWNLSKISKTHFKPGYKNDVCIKCKYLPVCLGPCAQKRFENIRLENLCFYEDYDQHFNDYVILKYKQFKKKYNL